MIWRFGDWGGRLVVLIAIAAGVARGQGRPLGRGVNFYSVDKEIALGRDLAEQLEKALPLVRQAELNDYLGRLGRLLAWKDAGCYSYTFAVFDEVKIGGELRLDGAVFPRAPQDVGWLEALAIPGGPVLVPLGILRAVDSEAQLAGALAHALAHIAARHGTRSRTREQVHDLATRPLAVRTAASMQASAEARRASSLSFLRLFEREADALAVELMAQAGYDPVELVRFLDKLPAHHSTAAAHPARQARLEAVRAAIELLPVRSYESATGEFGRVKARVAQLSAQ